MKFFVIPLSGLYNNIFIIADIQRLGAPNFSPRKGVRDARVSVASVEPFFRPRRLPPQNLVGAARPKSLRYGSADTS